MKPFYITYAVLRRLPSIPAHLACQVDEITIVGDAVVVDLPDEVRARSSARAARPGPPGVRRIRVVGQILQLQLPDVSGSDSGHRFLSWKPRFVISTGVRVNRARARCSSSRARQTRSHAGRSGSSTAPAGRYAAGSRAENGEGKGEHRDVEEPQPRMVAFPSSVS